MSTRTTRHRATRAIALVSILATLAACFGSETEEGAAAVNITPRNSQVYVRALRAPDRTAQLVPGPIVGGEVRVARDSLGSIVDSEAIVVYAQGEVTATVEGADDGPSFVLYAYADAQGSEAALQGRIGSGADGWTRVSVDPTTSRISGVGASGNYEILGLETTGERHPYFPPRRSPDAPMAITFVPVPRYQLWNEISGRYEYTVVLTCRDHGVPAPCRSFAAPGTRRDVPATEARAREIEPPSSDWSGGFFVDAHGPTLSIRWRQEQWRRDHWLSDSADLLSSWWAMHGRIEGEAAVLGDLEVGAGVATSSDPGRIEWYSIPSRDGVEEPHLTVRLQGHDRDPAPRVDVRLWIDGVAATEEQIHVTDLELDSETDGNSFFVLPRP